MPNSLPSHDRKKSKKLKQFKSCSPKNLELARKFRSSGLWQHIRLIHLTDNPLCFDPFGDHADDGRVVPAVQVHHIRGLATHYHLRITRSNLASICTGCHSKIEQMERADQDTHTFFN